MAGCKTKLKYIEYRWFITITQREETVADKMVCTDNHRKAQWMVTEAGSWWLRLAKDVGKWDRVRYEWSDGETASNTHMKVFVAEWKRSLLSNYVVSDSLPLHGTFGKYSLLQTHKLIKTLWVGMADRNWHCHISDVYLVFHEKTCLVMGRRGITLLWKQAKVGNRKICLNKFCLIHTNRRKWT